MRRGLKIAAVCAIVAALIFAEMSVIASFSKTDNGVLLSDGSEVSIESLKDSYINTLEIKSNRFTHVFESRNSISNLTTVGYTRLLENDRLTIMINDGNYDIRVVDRVSGYIWGGIESELAEDLNTRWKNLASSIITVTYLDSQLAEKTLYLADTSSEKSYKVIGNTAVFDCRFPEAKISLSFTLTLNDDGFNISIDDSTIVEDESLPITTVTILPFFGAARLDEINGYFFLPDGSGALMRFTKARDYISSYSKRIYGADLGSQSNAVPNNISDVETRPREFMIAQPGIMYPLFGTVHGVRENAFWVEIEDGAEYCSILADAASSRVNYHYIRSVYTYRECFIQPTAKNGTGVRTFQRERSVVNPSQTYHFLNGAAADYAGMASAYREKLIQRGELGEVQAENDIPLRLEVIASVRSKGYLGNDTVLSTSSEYIEKISEELSSQGIQNVIFDVSGWLSGGVGGYNLKSKALEKRFATMNRLCELNSAVRENGNRLMLNIDGVRMTKDQFSITTDIATKISQQQVKSSIDNDGILFPDTYYRRNSLLASEISDIIGMLDDNGLTANISGIGELLYSDWLKNEETTRSAALEMQSVFAEESGKTVGTYRSPNAYFWKYAKNAFDVPDHCSQYRYFTDTVPFLQMVLHGSVNCFSESLNEGTFSRTSVLRLIEYGQYPSFTVTEADNYALTDSALYDVYSTQYDNWAQSIVETENEINSALEAVSNAHIIGHDIISNGFVRVSYDNGVKIYVNYTESEKECDGVIVGSLDWLTVK